LRDIEMYREDTNAQKMVRRYVMMPPTDVDMAEKIATCICRMMSLIPKMDHILQFIYRCYLSYEITELLYLYQAISHFALKKNVVLFGKASDFLSMRPLFYKINLFRIRHG